MFGTPPKPFFDHFGVGSALGDMPSVKPTNRPVQSGSISVPGQFHFGPDSVPVRSHVDPDSSQQKLIHDTGTSTLYQVPGTKYVKDYNRDADKMQTDLPAIRCQQNEPGRVA